MAKLSAADRAAVLRFEELARELGERVVIEIDDEAGGATLTAWTKEGAHGRHVNEPTLLEAIGVLKERG